MNVIINVSTDFVIGLWATSSSYADTDKEQKFVSIRVFCNIISPEVETKLTQQKHNAEAEDHRGSLLLT